MAKKFVRGVTGVDNIDEFDKSLTNVNDIISDSKNTYVHTRKGEVESYYNLTDNVKQVESTDDLLTITKEDDTVSIANTGLATKDELATKQDTLTVGDGLSLTNNKIKIKPTLNGNPLAVNGFYKGAIINDFQASTIISLEVSDNQTVQLAFRESGVTSGLMIMRYRFVNNNIPTAWKLALIDQETINNELSQKQNTLSSNTSIGVKSDNSLTQLFYYSKEYNNSDGLLKTNIKNIASSAKVDTMLDEYTFIVKLNKGVNSISFELNYADTVHFNKIITMYGDNNVVRINGCDFNLSESTLTVSTSENTQQNYVITFSHIV